MYDLTNTYFEGRCKANPKAAYGRSKEKGKRRKESSMMTGDSRSWWSIKTTLSTHQRMTVEYVTKDTEGNRFLNTLRTNSRLEPAHLEIYTKLGLSGRPLNRRLLKRKIGSDNKNNQPVLQE